MIENKDVEQGTGGWREDDHVYAPAWVFALMVMLCAAFLLIVLVI